MKGDLHHHPLYDPLVLLWNLRMNACHKYELIPQLEDFLPYQNGGCNFRCQAWLLHPYDCRTLAITAKKRKREGRIGKPIIDSCWYASQIS